MFGRSTDFPSTSGECSSSLFYLDSIISHRGPPQMSLLDECNSLTAYQSLMVVYCRLPCGVSVSQSAYFGLAAV